LSLGKLVRFNRGADLFDLDGLFPELRCENFDSFLLLVDSRFLRCHSAVELTDARLLFLDLFVYLEELVE
jgi:hypothetical protein